MKTFFCTLMGLLCFIGFGFTPPSKTMYVRKGKSYAVVAAEKMNVLYIGVPNPISFAASNVPLNNIHLELFGGEVAITDKSTGKATVNVTTQGKAVLNVYEKINGKLKLIGANEFRVKRIPDPVATVFGKKEGRITKGELKAAGAVIAKLENFDFEANITIASFSFSTVTGGDLKEFICTGSAFTPEIQSAIDKARGIVIFENIKAKTPDGCTRTLQPIILKLI